MCGGGGEHTVISPMPRPAHLNCSANDCVHNIFVLLHLGTVLILMITMNLLRFQPMLERTYITSLAFDCLRRLPQEASGSMLLSSSWAWCPAQHPRLPVVVAPRNMKASVCNSFGKLYFCDHYARTGALVAGTYQSGKARASLL